MVIQIIVQGETALMVAAGSGSYEIIVMLLSVKYNCVKSSLPLTLLV